MIVKRLTHLSFTTATIVALTYSLPALSADLASHQITYQLQLAEADPETAIQDIKGKTVYTVVRECDGWKSGSSRD